MLFSRWSTKGWPNLRRGQGQLRSRDHPPPTQLLAILTVAGLAADAAAVTRHQPRPAGAAGSKFLGLCRKGQRCSSLVNTVPLTPPPPQLLARHFILPRSIARVFTGGGGQGPRNRNSRRLSHVSPSAWPVGQGCLTSSPAAPCRPGCTPAPRSCRHWLPAACWSSPASPGCRAPDGAPRRTSSGSCCCSPGSLEQSQGETLRRLQRPSSQGGSPGECLCPSAKLFALTSFVRLHGNVSFCT